MTQKAIIYGIVLYQLGISQDMVEEIKALVDENLELADALASPVVEHAEKRKVIDRVFDRFGSKELVNFMKTLCDNDGFDMINDIFDEYEKYAREQQDILSATLYYVTPPTDKQKAGIEDFLMKEYGNKAVQLSMVEKKEVSAQNAKKVFEKVFEEDIEPVTYIEEHGLKIVEDTGLLNDTLQKIMDENPEPLEELLGGKEKVFGFFVGKMMRELKGKASPDAVREALVKEVERRKNL